MIFYIYMEVKQIIHINFRSIKNLYKNSMLDIYKFIDIT